MQKRPNELEIFIHDISSPLTNIGVSLEYLKNQIYSDPHKLEKTIISTMDSLEYLFSITRRTITKKRPTDATQYSLYFFLKETIEKKFNFVMEKNNISLNYHLQEDYHVNFDKVLLDRAISNVISNSIDALTEKPTHKSRKLKISVYQFTSCIQISIVDNGIGISKSSLNNIFDIGYTEKTTHQGIGLPTSKEIVESSLKGRFEIKSLVGIGTVVKIILPI